MPSDRLVPWVFTLAVRAEAARQRRGTEQQVTRRERHAIAKADRGECARLARARGEAIRFAGWQMALPLSEADAAGDIAPVIASGQSDRVPMPQRQRIGDAMGIKVATCGVR